VHFTQVRFLLALLAAPAIAQLVPVPGTSIVQVDIGPDHAYGELVTNLAPGCGLGLQLNEFSGGDGEPDIGGATVVLNHLAWRRNTADSQTNVYLSAGAGLIGYKDGGTEVGLSAAFQLDWETRWLHAALMGHGLFGDRIAQAELKAHLGFAPWIASYEQVAPWILMEVSRVVGRDSETEVSPMLVLMYQAYRLELGITSEGQPRIAARWLF
jgi:hypothetical protein